MRNFYIAEVGLSLEKFSSHGEQMMIPPLSRDLPYYVGCEALASRR
jgi:hypothetical protein